MIDHDINALYMVIDGVLFSLGFSPVYFLMSKLFARWN